MSNETITVGADFSALFNEINKAVDNWDKLNRKQLQSEKISNALTQALFDGGGALKKLIMDMGDGIKVISTATGKENEYTKTIVINRKTTAKLMADHKRELKESIKDDIQKKNSLTDLHKDEEKLLKEKFATLNTVIGNSKISWIDYQRVQKSFKDSTISLTVEQGKLVNALREVNNAAADINYRKRIDGNNAAIVLERQEAELKKKFIKEVQDSEEAAYKEDKKLTGDRVKTKKREDKEVTDLAKKKNRLDLTMRRQFDAEDKHRKKVARDILSDISAGVTGSMVGQKLDTRGFSPEQVLDYQARLSRAMQMIRNQGLGINQVTHIFKNLNNGLDQFSGKELKVAATLKAIVDNVRKSEKEQTKIVEDEIDKQKKAYNAYAKWRENRITEILAIGQERIRGKVGDSAVDMVHQGAKLTGAEPDKVSNYNKALNDLRSYVKEHEISKKELSGMWSNLAGDVNIYDKRLAGLRDRMNGIQLHKDQLQGPTDAATKSSESLLLSWQNFFRYMVSHIGYQLITSFGQKLRESVLEAVTLQKKISEIQTITQSHKLPTDAWIDGLRKMSDFYGTDLMDQVEGMYQTISNQIGQGSDAFYFMGEANKFAAATVSTTASSVNLLSSVLNSFGINATQTDKIAAQLFETINLGRVRADEMENAMGKLIAPARELGVEFEELNAAIVATTIQGSNFDESSTFLRNMLYKLIKPTEEMKNLFAETGVASGQMAIATFGLTGFIEKVNKAALDNIAMMGKLYNNIRAIQGALLVASQGYIEYEEAMKAMAKADITYMEAVKITLDNVGKQFDKAAAQIKNYFTVDLGNNILVQLAKLTDNFKYLQAAAEGFVQTMGLLAAGGAAFLLYTHPIAAAVTGIALLVQGLLTYKNHLRIMIDREYNDWRESVRKVEIEHTKAYFLRTDTAKETADKIIRLKLQEYAEISKINEKTVEDYKLTAGAVGKIYSRLHVSIGKTINSQITALKKSVSDSESILNEIPNRVASLETKGREIKLDLVIADVKDPKDRVAKIAELMASARIEMQKAASEANLKEFDMQVASYERLAEEKRKLEEKYSATAIANVEKEEKARLKAEKAVAKEDKRYQKEREAYLKKKGFTGETANISDSSLDSMEATHLANLKEIEKSNTFIKDEITDTTTQQKELTEWIAYQKKLSLEIGEIAEKNKNKAEIELVRKELLLDNIKRAYDDVKGFNLDDVLKMENEEDIKKAYATYAKGIADILAIQKETGNQYLTDKELTDINNNKLEATKSVNDKLRTLENQKNAEVLLSQEKEVKRYIDVLNKYVMASKEAYEKIRDTFEQSDAFGAFSDNVKKILFGLKDTGNTFNPLKELLGDFLKAPSAQGRTAIQAELDKQKETLAAYRKTLGDRDVPVISDEAIRGGQKKVEETDKNKEIISVEDVIRNVAALDTSLNNLRIPEGLMTAYDNMYSQQSAIATEVEKIEKNFGKIPAKIKESFDPLNEFKEHIKGASDGIIKMLTDSKLKTPDEVEAAKKSNPLGAEQPKELKVVETELKNIDGIWQLVAKSQEKVAEDLQNTEVPKDFTAEILELKRSMEDAAAGAEITKESLKNTKVPESINGSLNVVATTTTTVTSGFAAMNAEISNVASTAERLRSTIASIAASMSVIKEANAQKGAAASMITGGTMWQYMIDGGSPKGRDSVPVMVSPEEMIMNPKSSRRFYSQLTSMNNPYSSLSQSGGSSITTGDFNISLQSTGNERLDVVKIGKRLRQEIRRGTVRLS